MENIKNFLDWIDLLCESSTEDLAEQEIAPKKDIGKFDTAECSYSHPILHCMMARDRKFPLETVTVKSFEQKSNTSLETPVIHYGTQANEFTRIHKALALTIGSDIFFRDGAYRPETEEGRALLAHELTHVAQHKSRPLADNRTREELETEAEIAADGECQETDPVITISIMGIQFRIKESQRAIVKGMIKEALKEQVEEYCLINNTDEARQLLKAYREAKFQGDIDEWLQ